MNIPPRSSTPIPSRTVQFSKRSGPNEDITAKPTPVNAVEAFNQVFVIPETEDPRLSRDVAMNQAAVRAALDSMIHCGDHVRYWCEEHETFHRRELPNADELPIAEHRHELKVVEALAPWYCSHCLHPADPGAPLYACLPCNFRLCSGCFMKRESLAVLPLLPTRVLEEKDLIPALSSGCVVCLMDFEAGDTLKTLLCFHTFHDACCDAWLSRALRCPVCKVDHQGLGSMCEEEPGLAPHSPPANCSV